MIWRQPRLDWESISITLEVVAVIIYLFRTIAETATTKILLGDTSVRSPFYFIFFLSFVSRFCFFHFPSFLLIFDIPILIIYQITQSICLYFPPHKITQSRYTQITQSSLHTNYSIYLLHLPRLHTITTACTEMVMPLASNGTR